MPVLNAKPRFIGQNSQGDASEIGPKEAASCLNINLDKGNIKKRSGYTEKLDLTNNIEGIFNWQRDPATSTPDIEHLIKSAAKLYRITYNASTGALNSASELGSDALTAGALASFAATRNRVYMTDGTVFKVTDGTNVYNAPIAPPASAPVVAVTGTTGNLDGVYDYKISHYASAWGQESPASSVTDQADSGIQEGMSVTVSGLTAYSSTDARVDKKRIYRRKVSAQENLWYFHSEIDDSVTTFVDSTLDVDVSLTDISPLTYDNSDLPSFGFCVLHQDVMFLAEKNSDNIYFTRPNQPWSVTNFLRLGGEGPYEKVTGLVSFGGMLVVFKENSIWTLSGLTEDSFRARPIVMGTGCVSHWSIVPTENLIYFWGKDGVYAFDGQQAVLVSRPVQDEILARNFARDGYIVGVEDKENQSIIWSYPAASSTNNDKQIVFFYGNSRQAGGSSWSPWSLGNINYLAEVTTTNLTKESKVWYGRSDGKVCEPGGAADLTDPIVFKWKTGKWDGELPEWNKAWVAASFEFVPTSDTFVEIRYYRDENSAYDLLDSISPVEGAYHLRLSERSRDLSLEIYQSDTVDVELSSFGVVAQRAGRP